MDRTHLTSQTAISAFVRSRAHSLLADSVTSASLSRIRHLDGDFSSLLDVAFWVEVIDAVGLLILAKGFPPRSEWAAEYAGLAADHAARPPRPEDTSLLTLAWDIPFIRQVLTDATEEAVGAFGPLAGRRAILDKQAMTHGGLWAQPEHSPFYGRGMSMLSSSPKLQTCADLILTREPVRGPTSMSLAVGASSVHGPVTPEPCIVVAQDVRYLFLLYCVLHQLVDPGRIGVLYDGARHEDVVRSFGRAVPPAGSASPSPSSIDILLIPNGTDVLSFDLFAAGVVLVLDIGDDPRWMVALLSRVTPLGAQGNATVFYLRNLGGPAPAERFPQEIATIRGCILP